MKFKYALDERVLYTHREQGKPDAECVGLIHKITVDITKAQTQIRYWINGQDEDVLESDGLVDSDILGTVTVKRTQPPRIRKRKITSLDPKKIICHGGDTAVPPTAV